jgi:hypothetical protein
MKKEKVIKISIGLIVFLWSICIFICLSILHSMQKNEPLDNIDRYIWWGVLLAVALYLPITIMHILALAMEVLSFFKSFALSVAFRNCLKLHIAVLFLIFLLLLIWYSFNVWDLFIDLYGACFMPHYFFSSW